MDLHIVVKHSTHVVFNDHQDINALREMASIVRTALEKEARVSCADNYNRQRAYRIALWLLENVPENTRP